MNIFLKKNTKTVFALIVIFLILLPFTAKEERALFLEKGRNFYSMLSEKNIIKTVRKKVFVAGNTVPVAQAIYPPSVKNLASCTFTTGALGDIFIKNRYCTWSENRCTLTDYDSCNGSSIWGLPSPQDACWCFGYASVCAVGVSPGGYSYCYSQLSSTGEVFAEPCDLCVRR